MLNAFIAVRVFSKLEISLKKLCLFNKCLLEHLTIKNLKVGLQLDKTILFEAGNTMETIKELAFKLSRKIQSKMKNVSRRKQ